MEIVGAENCTSGTEDLLRDSDSYILSEDQKSMSIDLTSMSSKDENKNLVVIINGIMDKAGNYTTPYSLRINLRANTQFRDVAKLVSVERVSLTELVATFDGMLIDAGELTVGNVTIAGEVDSENEYKAIYRLNDAQQKLTGKQTVTVNKWFSYYATGAETTGKQYVVDFTPSDTTPVLMNAIVSQSEDHEIATLTLVYDKNVRLQETIGSFDATLASGNGYIIPMQINYTAKAEGNKIIITVDDAQLSTSGEYTIIIPAAFCSDMYYNDTKEDL